MNKSLTDLVLEPPRQRPRVDYHRIFAWLPVDTEDAGTVWLERVWRITADGLSIYSKSILPL